MREIQTQRSDGLIDGDVVQHLVSVEIPDSDGAIETGRGELVTDIERVGDELD